MAILSASFNVADRPLAGYTAESGHVFAKHPVATTGDMAIVGGEVYHNNNSLSNIYYANVPPVTEGLVQAVFNTKASLNSQSASLMQRLSTTEDTGYIFGFNGSGSIVAQKRVAGAVTVITARTMSSAAIAQIAINGTYDVKYLIRNGEHRLYLNNVLIGIHEDASIAAAGVAGIFMARSAASSPTAAVTVDSMSTDIAAAVAAGPVIASFTAPDGTAIESYTSDSGHKFMRYMNQPTALATIVNGAVNKSLTTTESYFADYKSTAEHPVTGVFEYGSTLVITNTVGVIARATLGPSFAYNAYEATLSGTGVQGAGTMRVGKRTGGTYADFTGGSAIAVPAGTVVAGATVDLKLVPTNVDANTVEVRVFVNGVQAGGVMTDTAALPLGYSGFLFGNGTAGPSTNNPRLTSFSTGTPVVGLSLDRFQDYEVKQRDGLTGPTSFPTSGDVPPNTASLRYRLLNSDGGGLIQDYAAPIGLSISSGRWTGSLSLPQPGLVRMDIELQALDAGAAVLQTLTRVGIGVGEVFFDGPGDSQAVMRHHEQVEPPPPLSSGTKWASFLRTAAYGLNMYDPKWFRQDMQATLNGQPVSGIAGYGGQALAKDLTALIGVPIGFVICAAGGSTVDNWNGGGGLTAYSDSRAIIHNFRGFITQLGYNDGSLGQFSTRAQQAQRRRDLLAQWRGLAAGRAPAGGSVFPVFIVGSPSSNKPNPAPALAVLNRQSELDNALEANNYYVVRTPSPLADDVHLGNLGNTRQGQLLARSIGAIILGQPNPRLRITGATAISDTVTRFKVTHTNGTDILPAAAGAIKTVEVGTDEAMTSPLAISSVSRVSATEFEATHASAGAGPRFCRYNNTTDCGTDANAAGSITDNQAKARPLELTRGSLSIRPVTLRVTDSTGAFVDVPTQIPTIP